MAQAHVKSAEPNGGVDASAEAEGQGRRSSGGRWSGAFSEEARRSTGARLTGVFNVGVRSTGQFEVATKAESMTFREVCLLFLSMFINALPAIAIGCLFACYQGQVANSIATEVLDVLDEQPNQWAPMGFDYKVYGSRFPPGPGPHDGMDKVYGSREDLVATFGLDEYWASTPTVGWREIIRGYYGNGIKGHPYIGPDRGLWLPLSCNMISRTGMFLITTLCMHALFGTKLAGQYYHWGVAALGLAVAWTLDYFLAKTSLESGRPREGMLVGNLPNVWLLFHTFLVYWNAKYGHQLVGAARGVLTPMLGVVVASYITQNVLHKALENITTGSDAGWMLVAIRLLLWPVVTEVWCAPMRMILRSIPEEWADKSGLSFAMVPMAVGLGLLGRIWQYKIVDPFQMTVCNFALFGVELLMRCSVGHRDRLYARTLACMKTTSVKQLFGQKNNVKFRCDNLINEMIIEYFAMFAIFCQNLYLNKAANPASPTGFQILLLNLVMQVVIELLCDTVSLYIEIQKLKAPVVQAWRGRKASYPFFLVLILGVPAMYPLLSPLLGLCAIRDPAKNLMWTQCT